MGIDDQAAHVSMGVVRGKIQWWGDNDKVSQGESNSFDFIYPINLTFMRVRNLLAPLFFCLSDLSVEKILFFHNMDN